MSGAASELDGLRDISRRARIAYALCCLERVADTHHLDGDAWQDWRERAWRMTSAPKDQWHTRTWPASFAEIDDLFDDPVGGWGEGLADHLRRVFTLAKETCDRAIEGLSDSDAVRALGRELIAQQIEPPPIERFRRSPSHEMGGVGRPAPAGFYRTGVEREDFVWHLLGEIRSSSLARQRAAAFALRWLGLGTSTLIDPLMDAASVGDPSLTELATQALAVVASPEERAEASRLRHLTQEEVRAADTKQRREALLLPLLSHSEPSVRARAARSLAAVGSFPDIPALVDGLSDADRDTRREVARYLRKAPRRMSVIDAVFKVARIHVGDAPVQESAVDALVTLHFHDRAGVGDIAEWILRQTNADADAAVALLRQSAPLRRAVRKRLRRWMQRGKYSHQADRIGLLSDALRVSDEDDIALARRDDDAEIEEEPVVPRETFAPATMNDLADSHREVQMQAVRAVGRMSQPELAAEAIFLVADANSGNLEVLGAATRALMWMSGPAAGREVARFLIEHPDRSDTAILLLRRLHFLRGDVRDALVLAAQQSSAVASRVGTMLLKLDDEAAFGTPPSTSRVDLEALARWQREQPWHARFEAAEAGARANGRGIWKSWASEAGDTTRAIENRPLLLPAEPESWPPIASEVPAQPTLNAALNQLGDGRASFRWEALRLVGQLPRPDLAVETILLIADANRNNPDVFASARHALMWMSGGRAAREIVRFLFERPSRAETAVSLLCRLHYVRLDVVVALEALARSSSDEVVARARAFIERLGDRE